MRTITVSLPLTDDFLSDILTTVIETPFGDWFQWRVTNTVELEKGYHDIHAATLRYENGNGLPGSPNYLSTRIDLDSVALGIERILTTTNGKADGGGIVNQQLTRQIFQGAKDNDAGQIDCIGADAIIQAAVFNDLVFG